MVRISTSMVKTTTDTLVIGTGATAHLYLQTFNLTLSAIIGILTVIYAYARVRNELRKGKENGRDNV